MISTVTLNPSVDNTMFLSRLMLRETNWVQRVEVDAGGKGINCARMLKLLGCDTQVITMLGGSTGEHIRAALALEKIPCKYVRTQQNTRTCVSVKDASDEPSTVLTERGGPIQHSEMVDMLELVKDTAAQSKYTIFSGSVPAGINSDIYRILIQICATERCRAVLDCSGLELAEGIKSAPFMVAPNRAEAERLLGITFNTRSDVALGALSIADMGIPLVVISLGAKGAIAVYEGVAYNVTSAEVKVASTIGSGDSFVAGLVCGLDKGMDIEESLRLAAAAGAATALSAGTQMGTIADIERLRDEVKVARSK